MKNDFKSFLAVEFSNYLQLLLSAGRSTRNHEIMLRSLDSFLLQNHTFEKCLSESIINQWLSTICGTSANKVSYIARYRGLSKYLRSINITAFEPEYPRCSYTYAPYVFSDEEWKRMIAFHIAIIIQKVQSYFVFYYGCCTDAVCAEMRR